MFQVIIAAILAALLGAAFCFVGYRLFLVMLPIWGFFAGFWLGAEGTALILGGGFLATTTGWVIGFIFGLVGALLSYLFYMFGVVVIAGAFGAAFGSGILHAIGFQSGILVGSVALVAALIMVGLALALNIQKYVIIAISAIGGANAIVVSGLLLFGRVSLESLQNAGSAVLPVLQDSWFWLLIWLLIALAGFVVQVRTNQTFSFQRHDLHEGWG